MNDILRDKKLIESIRKKSTSVWVEMFDNVSNVLRSSDIDYSSRRNNDEHPNPPYFHQLAQLQEFRLIRDNPFPLRDKLRSLRRKRDWDDAEDQRLGPIDDRIKEVLDFEKKPIKERIRLVPLIVQSQIAMMNASPIKMKSPIRRGPYNPEKIEANRAKKRVIQNVKNEERKRETLRRREERTLWNREQRKRMEDTKEERALATERAWEKIHIDRLQREAQEKEIALRKSSSKKKIVRCKNGTRRSKKTGNCEPK
jgi:hypothetical protein